MVLIGTLYPLLIDALGAGKISVGPPYFGTLFAWLLIPLLLLVPIGFNARWQKDEIRRVAAELALPAALSLLAALAAWWFLPTHPGFWGLAAVAAGSWLILSSIRNYLRILSSAANGWPSRSIAGMTLAHLGVGVFIIGAGLTNAISSEKHLRMSAGDRFEMAGYSFEFQGTHVQEGPNFVADQGVFSVQRNGEEIALLHPQKRRYLLQGQVMTEAAIDPGLTRDLYVSLGEPLDDQGTAWAVRIYHKPFIRCIWLGALMMMFGGLLAASDRRYRTARSVVEAESRVTGLQEQAI
ncbi:MAG TPA: cytochrome c-type biogenesis CcmF C-terminal domain-containing protein, partial [Xanthomonadales bacterium]|nr:cytochrome c-type biogenesis CcmF C-terminal domain-containing protein [Xanthomonadales bacterium]